MITFPKRNISVGKNSVRIGCHLDGMDGRINYHIGDQLQGALILHPYLSFRILRIEGQLEFFVTGKDFESSEHISRITISGPRLLEGGSQTKIPFHFKQRFGRINSLTRQPNSYWRFTVTISPEQSKQGNSKNLLQSLMRIGGKSSVGVHRLQVPVINGRGNYRAEGQELRVRHFKKREMIYLAAPVGYLIFFLISNSIVPPAYLIHYLGLLLSLIIASLFMLRLTGFKDTPMELSPGRDGKLRLRMLDRGDGSWEKARIGLRVVAIEKRKNGKTTKLERTNLYHKEYSLSDIGTRKDHLVEATLPWPTVDLPTSYDDDGQGYTWELYLKTSGFFGKQEQAWPVEVSWEPFQLPEENNLTMAEESSFEETLELRTLKEEVRLKNEASD